MTKQKSTKQSEPPGAANAWLLQCAPGLAPILSKELIYLRALTREQQPYVKRLRNHDLMFISHVRPESEIAKSRIAEMILRCPAYGRFKISKRQLEVMADELKSLGRRRLVVSVAGKVFKRQDLARFLLRELTSRGAPIADSSDDETEDEVWMFCVDDSWYFGLPEHKARMTVGREQRQDERAGSLPPTIAAALVFAAIPRDNDTVWDPTCGSGTLLSEFHAYAPQAILFGSDTDPAAIAVARRNLGDKGQIAKNDSSKKAPCQTATTVVANLPFGVQFGERSTNRELYEGILRMALTVKADGWRGIFLTSDVGNFSAAAKACELRCEKMFTVKIRGTVAQAFRVRSK